MSLRNQNSISYDLPNFAKPTVASLAKTKRHVRKPIPTFGTEKNSRQNKTNRMPKENNGGRKGCENAIARTLKDRHRQIKATRQALKLAKEGIKQTEAGRKVKGKDDQQSKGKRNLSGLGEFVMGFGCGYNVRLEGAEAKRLSYLEAYSSFESFPRSRFLADESPQSFARSCLRRVSHQFIPDDLSDSEMSRSSQFNTLDDEACNKISSRLLTRYGSIGKANYGTIVCTPSAGEGPRSSQLVPAKVRDSKALESTQDAKHPEKAELPIPNDYHHPSVEQRFPCQRGNTQDRLRPQSQPQHRPPNMQFPVELESQLFHESDREASSRKIWKAIAILIGIAIAAVWGACLILKTFPVASYSPLSSRGDHS